MDFAEVEAVTGASVAEKSKSCSLYRMAKTRKSNRRTKRKGGAYPWVELPPEAPLVNLLGGETAWEKRGKVTKPFTPAVVIDNRVYVLMMHFDSEKATNATEPYPVYFYLGDVGTLWRKEMMDLGSGPQAIVVYYLSNGLRIQFRYREIDRSKGDILGRKNNLSMRGQGLEFFYSTDGINAGTFMSRASVESMTDPSKVAEASKGPSYYSINASLVKSIVSDIEKRV